MGEQWNLGVEALLTTFLSYRSSAFSVVAASGRGDEVITKHRESHIKTTPRDTALGGWLGWKDINAAC